MGNEMTVKIRHAPGPVVRVIGDVEWSAEAGWEQDVPVELAADLLAYPHPDWSLAGKPTAAARKALADALGVAPENILVPGEEVGGHAVRFAPTLAEVVGDRARAAELSDLGVTVKGLAALGEQGIHDLAFHSGATVKEIAGWVEQAKAA